jgi:hypothetical protein
MTVVDVDVDVDHVPVHFTLCSIKVTRSLKKQYLSNFGSKKAETEPFS